MSSSFSRKNRFPLERVLAYLYVLTEVLALIGRIQREPDPQFFVVFHFVRLLFIVCAIIFARVRLNPRFYIAGFQEMSEGTYWRLVLLAMFSMKALFLHRFVPVPSGFQIIEYCIVVFIITTLLMSYQGQIWAADKREQRQRQIAYLTYKAKLSEEELKAITPYLVNEASKNQRMPLLWKVTEWIIAIIVGSALNAYAAIIANLWIVNFLKEVFGIQLP